MAHHPYPWAALSSGPPTKRETSGIESRQLTDAFKSETGTTDQPLGVTDFVLVGLRRIAAGFLQLTFRRRAE